MKPNIAKKSASAEPWSIPLSAVVGFMTGIFVATIRHFSHGHFGYTSAALVEHFIPHLIATVSVCALLFALTAAFVNWFTQRR